MPEKEPAGWNGETRLVEDIWKDETMERIWNFKPTDDNTHIFLCGNPSMTETMVEILQKEGFQELNRGGVPASAKDKNDSLHGIYSFKKRLGTSPQLCRSGELALNPIRYKLTVLRDKILGLE